jgi:hypothetical protein
MRVAEKLGWKGLNYRHRGTTQKKAYDIQNVAKVRNREVQISFN